MRNRTALILLLPAILAAATASAAWTRPRELRARADRTPRGRPHVWLLTLLGAAVGLAVGVGVGILTARASVQQDVGHGAMEGTFLLVPGMLAGLAAGVARWATISRVHRRRRRLPRLRRR